MDVTELTTALTTLGTSGETVIGVVASIAALGIAIVFGRKLFKRA